MSDLNFYVFADEINYEGIDVIQMRHGAIMELFVQAITRIAKK